MRTNKLDLNGRRFVNEKEKREVLLQSMRPVATVPNGVKI